MGVCFYVKTHAKVTYWNKCLFLNVNIMAKLVTQTALTVWTIGSSWGTHSNKELRVICC